MNYRQVSAHIFTPEFYKVQGGIKTCVEGQIESLRNSNTIFKVYSLDSTRRRWRLPIDILNSFLSKGNTHVHGSYFLIIFAGLSCLFRSKLVKLYFHGSELEYIEQNQPILLIFFRIFIKGFGRNVEMLFVSEFLRKKIMSALRLDVNSTNTSVCYFGPVYKSKSSKTHFVKSNNKGPLKILTVSRIVRKKGLFEMLDVYEKLSRMIDVEWIIVGGGADEVDFKTDIAQRVNCKINYLGSVDPCSLPDLYENADVFWLCSKYEEGLGLVYLEAAAFDLPSIGLSRGGVVETIWHGKTGLLIDKVEQSLDAIIGLYRLPLSSGNFKSLLVERRNFEFFL